MTNQEAIDTIKTAIAQVEWDYPMDYAAAFDMATNALEKQIPKSIYKPLGINKYLIGKCPNCHTILNIDTHPMTCGFCGQAVKWE